MLREHLIAKDVGIQHDFRLRGEEPSRLEGFSDAVFGFALTLVVVSLDVPKNFDQLIELLRGLPSFLVCFLLLIQVWYRHYTFFRRFGLQDMGTVIINSLLLFVAIFYVYPLKYLFTLFVDNLLGIQSATTIEVTQLPILYLIYGIGWFLINALLGALYFNAYRQRSQLELSESEIFDTRWDITRFLQVGSVGLLSAAVGMITRDPALPGYSYILVMPISYYGARSHRAGKRKLLDGLAASTPPPTS